MITVRLRRAAILCLCAVLFVLPLSAYAQNPPGINVNCDTGATIQNGVEIIINQMRSGFTYKATAIGINGFDPVLAVLDPNGNGLCNDDEPDADGYTVDLPSTRLVEASNLTAQVTFSQNSSEAFADISLVVGGFGGAVGEFMLILEGMAVTDADGQGDPFSLRLTPEMVASGVPLAVYMLGRDAGLDPLMYRIDGERNPIEDANGDLILCDDAGTNLCWGESVSLGNNFGVITDNGRVLGENTDAMLYMGLDDIELSADPDFNFFNFVMTSYEQQTFGQYILAFHIGLAEAPVDTGFGNDGGSDDGKGGSNNSSNNSQSNNSNTANNNNQGGAITKGGFVDTSGGGTDNIQSNTTPNQNLPAGVAVDCDNGVSFNNGVEFRVVQMRAGFDYSATAIGLNGFDPVLAVLGEDGSGLCSDDDPLGAEYSFDLPTTGNVRASNLSSHVTFSNTSNNAFADIRLVVGGFGDAVGEFVLIVEGMGVTEGDGAGDPFAIRITPGMTFSDVPMSIYMMARTNELDPLMYQAVGDEVFADDDGNAVYCDDAGDGSRCYGQSANLGGSFVNTASGRVNGGNFDSMLVTPLQGLQLNDDPDNNFMRFVFTSFEQSTFGQYVLAFHVGTANP